MAGDRNRGCQRDAHPIRPALMAEVCRNLAADMRREAASGKEPIKLREGSSITRAQAAESMDRQAKRWEVEAKTGVLNLQDRRMIGQ